LLPSQTFFGVFAGELQELHQSCIIANLRAQQIPQQMMENFLAPSASNWCKDLSLGRLGGCNHVSFSFPLDLQSNLLLSCFCLFRFIWICLWFTYCFYF
jgi:hypothetical protein